MRQQKLMSSWFCSSGGPRRQQCLAFGGISHPEGKLQLNYLGDLGEFLNIRSCAAYIRNSRERTQE